MAQKRFQVKNTEMIMFSINKVQFARLNGKTYYLEGIVSFPYGHPRSNEIWKYRNALKEKSIRLFNI